MPDTTNAPRNEQGGSADSFVRTASRATPSETHESAGAARGTLKSVIMRRLAFLLVGGALTAACSGAATGPTLAPTPVSSPTLPVPTPDGPYSGTWAGLTNQGERFELLVTGSTVSRFTAAVSYSGESCLAGVSSLLTIAAPIVATDFAAAVTTPTSGIVWEIRGRFESATQAAGTLRVNLPASNPGGRPACVNAIDVTWTAQR